MSETRTNPNGSGAPSVAVGEQNSDQPKRRRRAPTTRRPSGPRPIYLIMQVLDAEGRPVQANKDNIRVVGVERDAHKVLEQIDNGENQYAFYQRVMLPPMRGNV